MGMYTEFHFDSSLKRDTPKNIIDALKFMTGETSLFETEPDHPLFKTKRWQFMLQCNSYYFDANTDSKLVYDKIGGYYLNIKCNLKNYGHEIQHFINWIMPYLDKTDGEFIGFYRYEEFEEPTLIYYKGGTND